MCWRLPFVVWMFLGFTPFVLMGIDIYFDGYHSWSRASVRRWLARLVVSLLAGAWIFVTGLLWLTPCPQL